MVIVFAPPGHETIAEAVTRATARHFDVVQTQCFEDLRVHRSHAWCTVVVADRVTQTTTSSIERLLITTSRLPLLLVSKESIRISANSFPPEVHAIVSFKDVETVLHHEIRHARAAGIRAMVRLVATLDDTLPPLARRAVLAAARPQIPYRTVAALAEAIGCSRSGLWKAWHGTPQMSRARLEDLIDWLLLIAAVSHKTAKRPWGDVAHQLGVHEHTLAHIAKRSFGEDLRALALPPGFRAVGRRRACKAANLLLRLGCRRIGMMVNVFLLRSAARTSIITQR